MHDAARIRSEALRSSVTPLGRPLPENRTIGGFGFAKDADETSRDQFGRAMLTMLLVLYPAAASVAVVVAAFMLSGTGGTV